MLRQLGIFDVSVDDVNRILQTEESFFVDVKAQEISPTSVAMHASAFANTSGGDIYIGIDEVAGGRAKAWRGFTQVEGANPVFQVLEETFEGEDCVTTEYLRGPGVPGFVLHLIIDKSRSIIQTLDGKIYKRSNAQKLPVPLTSHGEIERLRLDKGVSSYENTKVLEAAAAAIADSLTVTEFMIEAIPTSEAEPWLRSQGLFVDERPTVAGVLLFADEPQVYLPKRSAIKVVRYASTENEGRRDQLQSDPITIEGSLVSQIEEAVKIVREIIQEVSVQTAKGLQHVEYPTETIHEIVTNSVLHRDYSIPTDVQIRIFDNRIEVESPGRLPGHITVENILDEQFARNGKIVRLINKFPNPPNKDVGEGLNTAAQKMRDIGLKDPVIEECANAVVVTIRHERLASYETQIIEYLRSHDRISNSLARQITGEGSENKVKRVFEGMIAARQIVRDPEKRGKATQYLLDPSQDAT
jgi:ATP-dependent DNA helicase RecG